MNSLKTCLSCIVTTFSCTTVLADDWLRSVPDFELADHLGNTHALKDYEQYDLAVFYVQGVGCPIARIALPNYREVRDEYVSENLSLIHI